MATEQTPTPLDPAAAFARLRNAVVHQGWTLLEETPAQGRIRARTRGNLLSWGEEVTARVLAPAGGAGTIVVVESHPIAQIIDYGRSSKNVGTLIAEIQRE